MEAVLDPTSLNNALHAASLISDKENPYVIMECGDQISIYGTWRGTFYESRVEGQVIGSGSTSVPIGKLLGVASGSPVSVKTTEKGVEVRRNRERYFYPFFDKPIARKAFNPSLPKLVVAGSDLKLLIGRTVQYCEESSQYATGGCLIETKDNDMIMSCFTSRILAIQTASLHEDSEPVDLSKRPVVPAELLKVAKGMIVDDDPVSMRITTNEIFFEFPNAKLCGSLLAARCPDKNRLLAQLGERSDEVVIDPKVLEDSCLQVLKAGAKDAKVVKFTAKLNELELNHSSGSDSLYDGDGTVECECIFEGQSWSVAADGKLCASVAKSLEKGTKVRMFLAGNHIALESHGFLSAIARITI